MEAECCPSLAIYPARLDGVGTAFPGFEWMLRRVQVLAWVTVLSFLDSNWIVTRSSWTVGIRKRYCGGRTERRLADVRDGEDAGFGSGGL